MAKETSRSGEHAMPRAYAKRTRHRRLPPEVLTDEEVCELMQACGRYTPTGIRNRALIALLYRTGLRINEALNLYPKDLNLNDGYIRVLNGKGGHSRTVGLDPGAAAVVGRWLGARSKCLPLALTANRNARSRSEPTSDFALTNETPMQREASSDSAKLLSLHARTTFVAGGDSAITRYAFGRLRVFCTLRGNAMTDAYVRRLLKRLAERAGIDKRVHAHGLRHTHAAQLRAEGVDIGIISKQLGHASISTTARYLDHLAPRAVINAMRNRTWTSEIETSHP